MHLYFSESESPIYRKKIKALMRKYPHCKSYSSLVRHILDREFAAIVRITQKEYPEMSMPRIEKEILGGF